MLGGLFGIISENHFSRDLFFGIDYHSHLGTEVGGLAYLDRDIKIVSYNISNSQFKSEFQQDYEKIEGTLGIGVISDLEDEQPVKLESEVGTFALCTVGFIRNIDELYKDLIETGATFKKSGHIGGKRVLNQTEMVGELIHRGSNIVDGIEKMYREIDGSISILLLSQSDKSIYAAGSTFPLVLGRRGNDWAITSETSAFRNLGYKTSKYLMHREIISMNKLGPKTRIQKSRHMKFCPFLHVYFGFPTSDYYGINAEIVRERCGGYLAENDDVEADLVLGIADSGFPHSVGYVKRKIEMAKENMVAAFNDFRCGEIDVNELGKVLKTIGQSIPPLRRPLIKYTPGWGRSYIPPTQEKRETIAKYKQISNPQIIREKRIILVDDSIRRGTQLKNLLREKIWPYEPKEVHGRISSPPQIYPCIYDLSTDNRDLATWKAISGIERDLAKYKDHRSPEYEKMVEEISKMIGFSTLQFQTLENLVKAVVEAPNNKGLKKEDLCLYCWIG